MGLSLFLVFPSPFGKEITMNTHQNPFLTEVLSVCDESRRLYMQTLDQQQHAGQPVDWLERMLQLSQQSLDKLWQAAISSATDGNFLDAASVLTCIVKEWGKYKALQFLIDADQHSIVLDLWDWDTYDTIQKNFQLDVTTQVINLASQLNNALLAGQVKREQESKNSLMHGYTDLHGIAMQVIQRQDGNLQQAHQVNQQYADTAFQGVKQAQQSVYWMQEGVQNMYRFVEGHGANMVGGMQALQHHLEENLPSSIEQAREEARRRRTTRMFVWFLVVCVVAVGLLGLAAFIGTHLVGS